MGDELFRYDDKRVLVVGGATGMGAATAKAAAELGAETIVLDVAEITYPCTQAIQVDLRDRESVDAAMDAIAGPVDAVFACAGVADGTPGLMLINFISQRYLLDRLIATNSVGRGAAVTFISSVAGLGWMTHIDTVRDFISNTEWDSAAAWIDEHEGTDNYAFSKEAINLYVAEQGFPFIQRGLRINAILPGPTDTPLAQANADTWLTFGADYREAADIPNLAPEQMANTMLFLCSDAASGINGVTLLVDQGHTNAALVDAFEAPLVKMLAGVEEWDFSALGLE